WERMLRPIVGRVMVIDDLADRPHACELLLDQNLCPRMDVRYDDLIPAHCLRLFGPRYALVRDEFRQERAQLEERIGLVHKILLSFGGVDHANLTARALTALRSLDDSDLTVTVVLGATNQHREEVEAMCQGWRQAELHIQSNQMAHLMATSDLAIGAGGSTTWERAYLGLPSLVVVVAENQREITETAAQCGICWNLGWHEKVSGEEIAAKVREACANPQSMRKMSRQALAISARDYQTGAGEVANQLVESTLVYA
ncbi:UDP-2,4-diacetamido-2,4,6-trideoxy-beta-L-altropyranose hydrolase, partial [Patescibacteria group bacterium]